MLQAAVDALDEASPIGDPRRVQLVGASCLVAREHALSLRLLMTVGAGTSAISLLRLQYESITRAMWLTWAADDAWLEKLDAAPSVDAERAAGKLPLQSAMLEQLGDKAPKPAYDMLVSFRDAQMKTLNSFVHGGLHPLAGVRDGYPEPLLINVVQCSNALSTMGAMLAAIWTNDPPTIRAAQDIQLEFRDCLPALMKD
ncbi:MAG: hypothetical protein JNN20_03675 [Betaproteobacteria bacterium]|nr:hypothetical protein [Betaproteobacteria bacterium]